MSQLGGVVVTDESWAEYAAAVDAAPSHEIRVRFADSVGGEKTRIWKDAAGTLVCLQGEEVVPVLKYSEAMMGNTEPASESAVFLTKLVRGGMPVEAALELTNRIYRTRPHSAAVPDSVVNRFLTVFHNGR